jgi:hypothetical protein
VYSTNPADLAAASCSILQEALELIASVLKVEVFVTMIALEIDELASRVPCSPALQAEVEFQ